eukprot:TRINITY_DN48620_c0_g1_i1.p1 TRINITY_DN48620_c0_g1~~TRINITY_DN48620_c0_g1_i1.p1  ORF type:complete len:391 (+),score=63.36 TRINITY_DN48620_c0_g1_i1:166-1338(+)
MPAEDETRVSATVASAPTDKPGLTEGPAAAGSKATQAAPEAAALGGQLLEGEVVVFLLPLLSLSAWRALGSCSRGEDELVWPEFRKVLREALAPGATVASLLRAWEQSGPAGSCPRAAALRLQILTGISVEDLRMPVLTNFMYRWAHYGRPIGKKAKPHLLHKKELAAEFQETDGVGATAVTDVGIQALMRRELAAVVTAIRMRLIFGGSFREVADVQLVASDTPGKLEGKCYVNSNYVRAPMESTALMWATKHGVRWVEAFLKLGADASQVTPCGWTALAAAAAFESRGVVVDGSSDSNEGYGGYRTRTRGVVGPLLDAGARPSASVPLEVFSSCFRPTPIKEKLMGPVEIAVAEACTGVGWAHALDPWPRFAVAGPSAVANTRQGYRP